MDEREESYKRFKASVDSDSSFFDESELVEIFDYASDLSEDGTRMKVVIYASQTYPSSVPLLERRALLYYDLNDLREVENILKMLPSDSFIGKILNFRLEETNEDTFKANLSLILRDVNELEDEWVIQLINLAADKGNYDWLLENKESILRKTQYSPTFLYEMVDVALENRDYENALRFTEQLTEEEPFNNEFWEMLSEIYSEALNNLEEAERAVDYALAINPDSIRALIQKARILVEKGSSFEELMKYLDRAMAINPEISEPVIVKAFYYSSYLDEKKAASLLQDYMKVNSHNVIVLENWLKLTRGKIDPQILETFFKNYENLEEDKITEIAMNNYLSGNFVGAATIVKGLENTHGLTLKKEYFEIYYRNDNFSDVIRLYESYKENELRIVTEIDLLYILSRLHLKQMDGLLEEVTRIKEDIADRLNVSTTLEVRLSQISLLHYITVIEDSLLKGQMPDLSKIEPFAARILDT
ncbi:MAG: hypothetical protein J1E38_08565 [Paramuribaculum sp.]|nr:hypothetical protein [Paramuribaculum sp.]